MQRTRVHVLHAVATGTVRVQCIVNAVSRGEFFFILFLERYFGDTDSRILQISALIFNICFGDFTIGFGGENDIIKTF